MFCPHPAKLYVESLLGLDHYIITVSSSRAKFPNRPRFLVPLEPLKDIRHTATDDATFCLSPGLIDLQTGMGQ